MARIALLLTALIVLAASAATTAQAATISTPAGTVSWADSTEAGERFTITVRATRRVEVAILRTTAKGTKAVKTRTLRRGTITATLDNTGRYSIRVRSRGRTFRRPVVTTGRRRADTSPVPPPSETPPQPPAPAPPPSQQQPQPQPQDPCPQKGTASAQMTLDKTTVKRGESFVITVKNTGESCLTYGAPYHFERRQPDGSWKEVPSDAAWPMWAAYVQPGQSYTKNASAWPEEPGRYRVVDRLSAAQNPPITVTAELDITS